MLVVLLLAAAQLETVDIHAEPSYRTLMTLMTCSGTCNNGVCEASTGTCECYADTAQGYWDSATSCTTCLDGYAGPTCTLECPGGSCNQCSGHGLCSQGLTGDATCTCNTPWEGTACDLCIPNHYGFDCLSPCPGYPTTCGGNGVCDAGVTGTGSCTCTQDPVDGYWGTASGCTDCDDAHYGPLCNLQCVSKGVCSGHGECNSGKAGDGECACDIGWIGSQCSVQCPGSNATHVCGGSGTCLPDGTCACLNVNFMPPSCTECIAGRTGPMCTDDCPANAIGLACGGNGLCNRDGTCTCYVGYAHSQAPGDEPACQVLCPGGAVLPCSGNGVCNQDTALCECHDDDMRGHWEGAICDECKLGWSGRPDVAAAARGCQLPCPGGSTECSAHGTCLEGMCFCDTAWCSDACQTQSVGNNCETCPKGTWSHVGDPNECSQQCPGVGSAAGKCSGHGQCIETKKVPLGNNNDCVCVSGYGSSDCSQQCPGTPMCGGVGRGVCNPDSLECICFGGFAGSDCTVECPRDTKGVPCGGNTCFDYSWAQANGQPQPPNVLGECDCQGACQFPTQSGCALGYVGTSCSTACDCTVTVNGVVEAHGRCEASGDCQCDTNWAGSHCEKCVDGKYGTDCSSTCGLTTSSGLVTGVTAGLLCDCAENWYGENCLEPCKGIDTSTGLPGAGGVCSGKGKCNWGSTNTGECACEEYQFGVDCSVRCDASKCGHLNHWRCDNSGDCACIDDATGHWANTSTGCIECKDMWWGVNCDVPCDCSTHGTCDRSSGAPCECYEDPINGYWDGTNCERCKTGYVGLQCTGKHIPITRIGTVDPRVEMPDPVALYTDEEEGYIYAGGDPLLVISMRVAQGTAASFPVLSSNSRNQFGCHGTTGAVKFVTKYTDTIYMTVAACDGLRVYSMPSAQQGGVDFNTATLQATDGTVKDAAVVITSAARDVPLVATVLLVGTSPALRVIDLTTNSVRCQAFAISSLLSNATGVAVAYNGDQVYVSGTGADGSWAVVKVDSLTCGTVVLMNKGTGFDPGQPCDVVACIVMSRLAFYQDTLLGIIEGERGTGFTALNLATSAMNTITLSHTRMQGTAIAVDEVIDTCYAVVGLEDEPSVVSKHRFVTSPSGLLPVMYGELELTYSITSSGFAPERIAMLHPASTWRVLYGLASGGNQVRLIPFLLYEVHEVYPPVSDTQGGTVIDIHGRGFASIDLIGPEAAGPYAATCQVAGAGFEPATVVNETLMRCGTSGVDETAETSCRGDNLEVSLYGTTNTLTVNEVAVTRVHSVAINESMPSKGFHTGNDQTGSNIVVTVTGYGFQQSSDCPDCLTCRFYDNKTEYFSQGPSMVTFISPYAITCLQPPTAGASTDPSFLDVALDGQVYSQKPTPYVVVGDPSGLAAELATTVLKAAMTMAIPDITVYTVDSEGHTVLEYDDEQRPVTVEIAKYTSEEGTDVDTGAGSRTVFTTNGCTTTDGKCVLSGVAIEYPVTGDVTLRIATTTTTAARAHVLAAWETTLKLRVIQGDPVQILVQDQPSLEIPDGYTSLPTQPVIVLADEIGNFVREYPNVMTAVAQLTSDQANYTHGQIYPSKQTGQSEQNGVLSFEGVAIRSVHGVVYQLNFSIPDRPELGHVLSDEMQKVSCDNTRYAIQYTEHCAPCPTPGGVCNGTSEVTTAPGYWREDENTTTFYKCKSSDICLGGSAGDDLCAQGTTGPTCAVCIEGYGKSPSGCTKCSGKSSNLAAVSVVFILVLCVLIVWIIITLGKTVDSAYTIIGRILVSHMQAGSIGNFSENWSLFMKDVFDMQSQGSTLSVDGFSALDCLMREMGGDYYTYFAGYMLLPVFPVVIAGLVYGVIVARRTINPGLLESEEVKEELAALSKKSGEGEGALDCDEEKALNNIYAYQFSQVLLTTMSVCLFVLYPTLINQAAVMLRCDTYQDTVHESTPTGWQHTVLSSKSFLSVDHSIDCSTSKYNAYYLFATLGLVGYGLGIPIVFVLSVRRIWKKKGYERTYVMFIFLMGGFTKKSWFWQAIIMLRKLALGLIAVFVQGKDDDDPSNDPLQSYVAIWVIMSCLVIQLYVNPYQHDERSPYNNLEALSLGVITLTLNLGLLYNWQDMPTALRNGLTVLLAGVTFATLGCFIYYIISSLIPEAHKMLDKDGDGKFTMFDLKLWLRLESITEEQVMENKARVKKDPSPRPSLRDSWNPSEIEPFSLGDPRSPPSDEEPPIRSDSFTSTKNPLHRYCPPELTPASTLIDTVAKPTRRRTATFVDDNIEMTLLPEGNSVWDDSTPPTKPTTPGGRGGLANFSLSKN